jgi:hypothetical protein
MEVDLTTSAPASASIPEIQVFFALLVMVFLLDQKQNDRVFAFILI